MTAHIFPYCPAACFKVFGEDAGSYLQGQFSNELRQPVGRVVYGLFLNGKGKVVADAQVLKLTEQAFLLTSYFSTAEVMRQRLEEFIVADDVGLEDLTPQSRGLSIWGPKSGEIFLQRFQAVPQAGQCLHRGELLIYPGRRSRDKNYEIIGPNHLIETLQEQLLKAGCVETGANQLEHLRITHGIPAIPGDIGPGDLPNEGNLDADAVSYTKGCYLGQEVMARLKNMGQVRRRLFVVQGTGTTPGTRGALFQQGKKIGEIRSGASKDDGYAAMAMLTLLNLDEAAGLSLEPDAPPTLRIQTRG